jgi:hypothetical protein
MSNLVFQATSGGSITLTGANTATTATITIPAVNGTFITTGDTGTVTSTMISGPLTVAVGGTGAATFAANNVLLGNGTSAFQVVAPGTTGNVLTSNGTTWASTAATSQVYPGAGIANSTGSAWGTSYTTSGSGTVVALATTPTLTNPTVTNYVETLQAVGTVGSTSTLALTTGTVLTATLTASTPCTFTMPTATAGKSFILKLTQAATGMTTATFTSVKWPGGTAPTITATASAVDILSFVADGTNWYGTYAQAFA